MQMSAFKNEKYAKQLVDFSGLRFGNGRMPTDIDAFMEFDDKQYVFVEAKYHNAAMPKGQQLALERLVDALGEKRYAILIIANHYEKTPLRVINLGESKVVQYRSSGKWITPQVEISVRELIETFLIHTEEVK